jgi:hypothetical protein
MHNLFRGILQSSGKSPHVEYHLQCQDDSLHGFEGVETNLLDEPQVEAIIGKFEDPRMHQLACWRLPALDQLLESIALFPVQFDVLLAHRSLLGSDGCASISLSRISAFLLLFKSALTVH